MARQLRGSHLVDVVMPLLSLDAVEMEPEAGWGFHQPAQFSLAVWQGGGGWKCDDFFVTGR